MTHPVSFLLPSSFSAIGTSFTVYRFQLGFIFFFFLFIFFLNASKWQFKDFFIKTNRFLQLGAVESCWAAAPGCPTQTWQDLRPSWGRCEPPWPPPWRAPTLGPTLPRASWTIVRSSWSLRPPGRSLSLSFGFYLKHSVLMRGCHTQHTLALAHFSKEGRNTWEGDLSLILKKICKLHSFPYFDSSLYYVLYSWM